MNPSISWLLALSLAIGAGCDVPDSEEDSGTAAEEVEPEPEPEPTEAGEPIGDPVTATIGADGGTLTTLDGRFTVTIPAGALDADTEIGIQPITNLAWGGIGEAYRLTPSDLVFAEPVELTLFPSELDLIGTAPEFVRLLTQDDDGYWSAADSGLRSAQGATVYGPLRDVGLGALLRLVPASARVGLGEDLVIVLEDCATPDQVGGFSVDAPSHRCSAFSGATNLVWSVEGVPMGAGPHGTMVDVVETAARYRAPSRRSDNIVDIAVSVGFEMADGRPITLSMVVVLVDQWVGQTTLTGTNVSVKAVVTFESTVAVNIGGKWLVKYAPIGQADLLKFTVPNCEVTPPNRTRQLTADDPKANGYLMIDYDASTYYGAGNVTWNATCSGVAIEITTLWFGNTLALTDPFVPPFITKTAVPTPWGTLGWDFLQ